MDAEDNKALDRRWYDEVLNGMDWAVIDEIVAPGFVFNGQLKGPDGMKRAAIWVRSVFPDLSVTIEEVLGMDDRVVTRWTGRATHHGKFLGIPPTGMAVTLTGDRIANGQIVDRWEEVDVLGLLQGLGVKLMPEVPTG